MSVVPPMSFDVGALMDGDRMLNGPMVVFWGQEQEEVCRKPLKVPETRLRWRDRLRRRRLFRVDVRLEPAEGTPLDKFGQDVSRILGISYMGDPEEGDRAIWIPGSVAAPTAPHAIGSCGGVLQRLGNMKIRAAQVRAELEPPRRSRKKEKEEAA